MKQFPASQPLRPALLSRRSALLAAGSLCLAAPWARAAAPIGQPLRVGPGESLRRLADALRLARDGDTIELQPGVYPGDVGVIEQRGIVIRGLGAGAVLEAEGRHAEGKAILVCRGDVTLENLEFRGCRVPSGNGAGVRFERGRLRLLRCRFHDNEMGLLSAGFPDMTLDVVDCEFGTAPRHAGPLHHLLYVGTIGSLRVQGSRLEQGWRGHLLKSRARNSLVIGNWLVDGPLGEASYELDFPNGGDVFLAGNVISQSAATQNQTLVSMGAEAGPGMSGRLRMLHNTLVNHTGAEARFIRVWNDRLPADTPVWLANNLFAGPGQSPVAAQQDGGGNQRVELEALRAPERADYRLRRELAMDLSTSLAPAGLPPTARFRSPLGSRGLPVGKLMPGALQADD